MIREGEGRYTAWKKRNQSLSYIFREEIESILIENKIDSAFSSQKGHPLILKEYLRESISIETMVILDKILGFRTNWDKDLKDPVWETVSLRMRKYSPLLNIDVFRYKKIVKEVVLGK